MIWTFWTTEREDADKPFYQQIIPIPNKEVSKIGPEIIHKFNFHVQIYNYGDTLPNQYLDYMLKNCPHLIRFWITFASRRHPRQEDTYSRFYGGASKDITYLPVPEILPTKQNMTQIRLSGSLLSEEFMDLLTSQLTNLDTLEYTFEKRDMIHHTESEYHFNIDLDVTKALNLQTLHLDMEYVYRDKFDYIFLRINYPGCGEGDNLYQYYFLDTNPDFTYRESFTKKQYIIYPSDASMLDYCGNNQRLKTYTITVKASSKLNTICFSDRERSLTDNVVLVKPTTFSIMQKIEGLLLTDN